LGVSGGAGFACPTRNTPINPFNWVNPKKNYPYRVFASRRSQMKPEIVNWKLSRMSDLKKFEHQSTFAATVDELKEFHSLPDAFKKLNPPPLFVQVLRDNRTSLTNGDLEFNLWMGPFPIRWIASHEPGPTKTSFVDRMVDGPHRYWKHEHIFEPTTDGVRLIDRVTYAHKSGLMGLFTRILFDGLPLWFYFIFRHWRTGQELKHLPSRMTS
jgi:ligand-binding SRPBCC domain-containing protein